MTDANDLALVREFAGRNSEQAFAELVRRHLNLVYSVAMRYTGNTGDAQDVAQAVFVTLARKAAGLSTRTVLTGWLYETTRFTASRLLRTQARRRAHEYEASMQSNLDDPGYDDVWRQLAPHLEAAMSRLGERDRTLLALRYYQNMTGAEAAAQLGIHEEAARKRTNRALEKLRRYFAQHGVNSTPAIIAGAIASNSIQAAPAGLAKTISAVAVAKAATASTSTLTLSKGALKIMAWTKTKTAIAAAVVVALIGTGGVGGYTVFRAYHSPTNLMASSWYIQPDGICHVLVTMKIINTSGKAIGVNDSEPLGMGLNIDQITDETGQAIKFTKDPGDKGSPFRYSYTLNRPIPPGARSR
jgi:RNA polymerase sigma factor (sigma-70 family)